MSACLVRRPAPATGRGCGPARRGRSPSDEAEDRADDRDRRRTRRSPRGRPAAGSSVVTPRSRIRRPGRGTAATHAGDSDDDADREDPPASGGPPVRGPEQHPPRTSSRPGRTGNDDAEEPDDDEAAAGRRRRCRRRGGSDSSRSDGRASRAGGLAPCRRSLSSWMSAWPTQGWEVLAAVVGAEEQLAPGVEAWRARRPGRHSGRSGPPRSGSVPVRCVTSASSARSGPAGFGADPWCDRQRCNSQARRLLPAVQVRRVVTDVRMSTLRASLDPSGCRVPAGGGREAS